MAESWSTHELGEWRFRIRPARAGIGGYYGEAKRGDFIDDRGGPWEPGEIWFSFADSEADVLADLKRDVLH